DGGGEIPARAAPARRAGKTLRLNTSTFSRGAMPATPRPAFPTDSKVGGAAIPGGPRGPVPASPTRSHNPMNSHVSTFTSHARTWLLVAGLTALLLAIGATLGGGFLAIAVILALVMNVGGYWFSDRVALRLSGARPLSANEAPGLHQQ